MALLGDADADVPGSSFYDRLAEAVCRLGGMRRAAVYLSDEVRRRSWVVGAFGISRDELSGGAVGRALPLALRALERDEILEVRADLALELPAGDIRRLGLSNLACIPMSAGGRPYGVVLAERGDPDTPLSDDEREALWMVGKVCALAASARVATRQQERSRQLADRLDLAREVHERVVQRLFGVSLALGATGELTPAERARCADELQAATEELRQAIQRPLSRPARDAGTSLREELDRLSRDSVVAPLHVDWAAGVQVPATLEPLARSVVAEAVRNAGKHAAPTRIDVRVEEAEPGVVVTVVNDGATDDGDGTAGAHVGVGLRLATFDALAAGAAVDFGRTPPDRWQVRLSIPVARPA